MKIYTVEVNYTGSTQLVIRARSEKEAKKIAKEELEMSTDSAVSKVHKTTIAHTEVER